MQANELQGSALIGAGVQFTGSIQAPRQLVVNGHVTGEVTTGALVVGEQGLLQGQTTAQDMHVRGMLNDAVTCHGLLHVAASGTVRGDVTYGQVEIVCGGRLLGAAHTNEQVRTEPSKGQDKK